MQSRVVDVAGVPIELRAIDETRAESLAQGFIGFATSDVPAVATITVDDTTGEPPPRPPYSELFELRFWDERDGLVMSAPGLLLTVDGTSARVQLPDVSGTFPLETSVYLPLTWLLARHERFVLHGAGIARDGRALLMLGHSGAGKSTLIAAALEAGWQALADDVVIVHRRDGEFCIHGVHRIPAIPTELGGPVVATGRRLEDPRDRAALPRHVLTDGGHALAGVVLITHSESPRGSLEVARGSQALPLLLQSFAANVDARLRAAFFETAADISRLPVWELGLAAELGVRRARASHHLALCAEGQTLHGVDSASVR
jgi:hypothetical protein